MPQKKKRATTRVLQNMKHHMKIVQGVTKEPDTFKIYKKLNSIEQNLILRNALERLELFVLHHVFIMSSKFSYDSRKAVSSGLLYILKHICLTIANI